MQFFEQSQEVSGNQQNQTQNVNEEHKDPPSLKAAQIEDTSKEEVNLFIYSVVDE